METASSAQQLQFFLAAGATVLVGLFVSFYAAHCFAVVVDETAAGNDEVRWQELSIFDWIAAMAFLAWLLVLAAIPVWIVMALAAPDLVAGVWGTATAALAALWLLFPIFLLSALTGQSRLVVLHGKLLRRLVRRPGSLLLFYMLTAITLGGAGTLAIYALEVPLLLLLAAPVAAAAFLIHARLMGRLAWLIGHRTPITDKPKRKRIPMPGARPLAVVDPWAIPGKAAADTNGALDDDSGIRAASRADSLRSARRSANPDLDPKKRRAKPRQHEEEENEWTARKKPYAVRSGPALPPPPRKGRAEPPPDPYGVRAGAPERGDGAAMDPDEADREDDGSDELEIGTREEKEYRLAAHQEPTPPAHPFFSGVFTFPASYTAARAWLFLSLGNLAFGYLVYLTVAAWRP